MTRVSRPGGQLTDLEASVLQRAGEGLTTEATARLLGCSMPAVQDARHRLMGKLGAKSMPHAILLACRAGLLDGRPQRHGDHAGFVAHTRRGEAACDDCVAGELDYQAERRQKRRQKPASARVGASEAVRGVRDGRGGARAPQGRSEPRGDAAA